MNLKNELYNLFSILFYNYNIEPLTNIIGLDFDNIEDINIYRFLFTNIKEGLENNNIPKMVIIYTEDILTKLNNQVENLNIDNNNNNNNTDSCVNDCELCQICIPKQEPTIYNNREKIKTLDINNLSSDEAIMYLNQLKFDFDILDIDLYKIALGLFNKIENKTEIKNFINHIFINYKPFDTFQTKEILNYLNTFQDILNNNHNKTILNDEKECPGNCTTCNYCFTEIPEEEINIEPERKNFETNIFDNIQLNQNYLLYYLLNKKKIENYCAICGLNHWQNEPLQLILDYKDGNKLNQDLSNLQLLCPNCFSQVGHG